MSNDLIDLGRRAVACEGWRWLPGMLESTGARYVGSEVSEEMLWIDPVKQGGDKHYEWPESAKQYVPDLSDPATLGCLLHLVRGAWDCPTAYAAAVTQATAKPWRVWLPGDPVGYGATEAEALVVALEAAGRQG